MLNVALLGTWHRRAGLPYYYRRALRQLGCNVFSIGPWRENEPFGTYGREPDLALAGNAVGLSQNDLVLAHSAFAEYDCIIIASGGESLRLLDAPSLQLAHVDSEGAGMEWSRGLTPHRYAEIMCNNCDADVKWLPKAFDVEEHHPPHNNEEREYDLVQLASARDSRKYVWEQMRTQHPDLNCFFGDVWGALYGQAYRRALATWVCSTLDFVTTRVFEAMAMGCIVIADMTPSIAQLFTDGTHFVGYQPYIRKDGEGIPYIPWLAQMVGALKTDRHLRSNLRSCALNEVWQNDEHKLPKHSYQARMARVLCDMGLCRWGH